MRVLSGSLIAFALCASAAAEDLGASYASVMLPSPGVFAIDEGIANSAKMLDLLTSVSRFSRVAQIHSDAKLGLWARGMVSEVRFGGESAKRYSAQVGIDKASETAQWSIVSGIFAEASSAKMQDLDKLLSVGVGAYVSANNANGMYVDALAQASNGDFNQLQARVETGLDGWFVPNIAMNVNYRGPVSSGAMKLKSNLQVDIEPGFKLQYVAQDAFKLQAGFKTRLGFSKRKVGYFADIREEGFEISNRTRVIGDINAAFKLASMQVDLGAYAAGGVGHEYGFSLLLRKEFN